MANRKLGLNLPSDVITDILCQLPVKTLLRFRCASKRWCSQIDSPDFIKLHLSHSLATKSNRSLLLKYWNEIYSVELDSLRTHIATELNPPIILKDEMIGCIVSLPCNGLVAVWRWNIRYLEMTLWNPSTRKHQRLPRIRTSTPCNALIGLGHDPISDDYKVMVQHHNGAAAAAAYGLFGVKVYSLKTNSWREINELPNYFLPHLVPDQSNRRSRFGLLASGALHWVSTCPGEFGGHCTIVAFDLAIEEFRIIPQPDHHDHVDIDGGNLEMHLGVLEGRLCMICNYDISECVDVWVMKEYGLKESWTKLFEVRSQSSTFNRTFQQVMPLAYSESGDKVLLEVDDTELYWYDFRRKRAERVRNIQRYPNYFTISDVYVESLVPLAGGGLILDDRKTQQPPEEKKEKL